MKSLPLFLLLAGCSVSWGRDPPPPEPTVRLCLAQREIMLRRGEVLRTVELQPCVPALGEFK
jgi:hypothetical protein